jgi:hypothetical protein
VSRLRIALAVAVLALGLAALAGAHDVGAWKQAVGDGRAPSTWLPGDPAGKVLALDGDLALRRGERAFAATLHRPKGYESSLDQVRKRAVAVSALSAAVDLGSARQASRAGNLLGILAATAFGPNAGVVDRNALATFDAAIRADPAFVDPKYNLELLFRRIKVVGSREGDALGPGAGAGPARGAGAAGAGAGY